MIKERWEHHLGPLVKFEPTERVGQNFKSCLLLLQCNTEHQSVRMVINQHQARQQHLSACCIKLSISYKGEGSNLVTNSSKLILSVWWLLLSGLKGLWAPESPRVREWEGQRMFGEQKTSTYTQTVSTEYFEEKHTHVIFLLLLSLLGSLVLSSTLKEHTNCLHHTGLSTNTHSCRQHTVLRAETS